MLHAGPKVIFVEGADLQVPPVSSIRDAMVAG